MSNITAKPRRKLNTGQLEVLELLYKFRFGSNDLFAQYFGKKDRSFVHNRLSILLEQGLVGKRFDSSYRLQGKPAAYYLTPAGARALQDAKGKELSIKAIYREKSVSEDFISYCMKVFAVYCQLRVSYGDSLKFLTKTQLVQYNYFSDFAPSAYFRFKNDTEKDFFMEYLPSSKPFFTFIRRIKQYSDYFDGGEWEEGTGTESPTVLLVCETPTTQKRLLKKAYRVLEDVGDGLGFFTITEDAFMQCKDALWINMDDPEEQLTLGAI